MSRSELKQFVKNSNFHQNEKEQSSSICTQPCCWWAPRQNSMFVTFSDETSIHGLKFLGQRKRHCSERIFWMVAFIASFGTAVSLIYGVWDRYENAPVIVSLQPSEQDMDSIPFPAVTICNMNKFPKRRVKELESLADNQLFPQDKRLQWRRRLDFVRSVCNTQESFAKKTGFAETRGKVKANFTNKISIDDTYSQDETQRRMTDFLIEETLHCDQLIRLCIFEKKLYKNCSELFKPVITDYGKCCTFNIMPLPLLFNNPQKSDDPNASPYDNPVLGNNGNITWPQEELDLWNEWNYDTGFVMEGNMSRPWRQHRAGLPYGMSLLLDPNLDDYFCPASDSFGMRYILHTPVELPHVTEFSSVAHLGKEILIEVHPDVTNADDDIRNIDHEKRLCYFGKEQNLRYFGPYTGGNCVDECMARELSQACGCSQFYMPRDTGIRVCNTEKYSKDYNCTTEARANITKHLQEICADCDSLCENIVYNYETTVAELQKPENLWGDPHIDPKYHNATPDWANHKMSVVHIFFGAESTVPKYRKRLYGITDLIANTGAILGLCLGFSILSGVELIYFLTIRSFWTFCRKRNARKQNQKHEQSTNNAFAQLLFQRPANKKLQINPKLMRDPRYGIHPNDLVGYQYPRGWGNSQGHHFYDSTSFHQKQYRFERIVNVPPQSKPNF